MLGTHDSFRGVQALPEPQVRALLASPEATQRVWAAWALALRLGQGSTSVLERVARNDPDPGLRRHLVVLLASFGEREAVAALAVADPDPHVRASGCQYLARLAVTAPALWPLVLGRFADPSPLVREALVQHLPADAPPEVRAAALRCVEDEVLAVRQAVVERCAALVDPGSPFPEALRARAPREPEAGVRRLMLMAWRSQEGSASFLGAVARTGGVDLTEEALELVAQMDLHVPWSALCEVAGSPHARIRTTLAWIFRARLDEVPLGWLLQYLAGEGADWFGSISTHLAKRLAALEELEADDLGALGVIAQAAAEERDAVEEKFRREKRECEDDEQLSLWEEEKWQWNKSGRPPLEALIAQAKRLGAAEP